MKSRDQRADEMVRHLETFVPELPPQLRVIWGPHFVHEAERIGLTTDEQWERFKTFCADMMADVDYARGQTPGRR